VSTNNTKSKERERERKASNHVDVLDVGEDGLELGAGLEGDAHPHARRLHLLDELGRVLCNDNVTLHVGVRPSATRGYRQ
jgi:hypothetical protein